MKRKTLTALAIVYALAAAGCTTTGETSPDTTGGATTGSDASTGPAGDVPRAPPPG